MKNISIEEQVKVFKEGCIDLIGEEQLIEKLKKANGKPLKIKYGADPSAADIHLGHTVPLRKLRKLQDLGHEVIFLIGDFTAMIGDPTGRSQTRKRLTKEDVQANAETYKEQVFRILDKEKTKVVYNSEWLGAMSSYEFLELTSRYTVARILERDDFKKRFESDKPITILEFMYPLLQGYDSVALEADVEVGGSDQKFNLLVGRQLQRDFGQTEQIVMTLPLIEGTDGVRKMSKSFGNSINVHDSATEMFGKIMSIPDELIAKYFLYLTDNGSDFAADVESKVKGGNINPRDLKVDLAKQIISFFHCEDEANRASEEFDRIFKKKGVPDDLPQHKLASDEYNLVAILADYKLSPSKSEARRMIKQGAVKVNQEKVTDINAVISITDKTLVQCGKRKFAEFIVE